VTKTPVSQALSVALFNFVFDAIAVLSACRAHPSRILNTLGVVLFLVGSVLESGEDAVSHGACFLNKNKKVARRSASCLRSV
jgi:hypothetical protein